MALRISIPYFRFHSFLMTCTGLVELVIDSRETQLKLLLSRIGCPYRVEQLPIGDVMFVQSFTCTCHEQVHLLLCERKTMSDLYSSITSGRYAEQRERLKTSGVKICYLVESYMPNAISPLLNSTGRKLADISRTVGGALENLVLYHNIFILPTLSTEHTAKTLNSIKDKLAKKSISEPGSASVSISLTPRKDKVMENIHENQLMLIPGVSATVVKEILKKYPTVKSLFTAYGSLEDDERRKSLLADIVVGKKRLGKVLSTRIYDVYNM